MMKVYRVERSERSCGEWTSWLIDKIFSTHLKAVEWINDNPISYVRQEVVEQEIDD
jgi:hypothetical protein